MDKIFDYENPNAWSSYIRLIMNRYLNEQVLNELLEISNEDNRYIDIEDVYKFIPNSILTDIFKYINENNCFIKLYHATATNNIDSYLQNGLCVLNSNEKNKYARELFNKDKFPDLTDEKFNVAIQEHLEYLGMEVRENRISFMTHKEHLIKNETHYLTYGSEYIFILAQRLGYEYKYFLQDTLKPALLTCKIPFELLNDEFASMTISNIIVKYIENIIYPEEIYKEDNYEYRNDAEIYINSDLDSSYILNIEHPDDITCTKFGY